MFLIDATPGPTIPSFVGGAQPSVKKDSSYIVIAEIYICIGDEGLFYDASLLGPGQKLFKREAILLFIFQVVAQRVKLRAGSEVPHAQVNVLVQYKQKCMDIHTFARASLISIE